MGSASVSAVSGSRAGARVNVSAGNASVRIRLVSSLSTMYTAICPTRAYEVTSINARISTMGTTAMNRYATIDRKSTRLNSSHRCISYAVFCLKKKKKKNRIDNAAKDHAHYDHTHCDRERQ